MRDTPKYLAFYICAALALITIAVFWQVRTLDFVDYDDSTYVYENPNIQSGLTLKSVKWAFSTGYNCNWHPLTWLSHMLDWQLFESKPAGHHLTNLILHIANTLLLFIVLKQMTQRIWPSAFVAALFALHPLHVESVAWVAERKDVLSTFFWFLTMWAYLRYVKKPAVGRYLLTLLTFVLGLMAKPMLVTLPFVLLLLDYWPLVRAAPKRHLICEKVPFFALSAASSIVTFFVQQSGGAVAQIVHLPLQIRILNALISYIEYIRKMIWPTRLAFFYPHPDQTVSIPYAAGSAIALLVVTIVILWFAKKRRYLITGWFWYLGTLLPVIGIVQVGIQARADRYTYIPLTGLFIIIAWGMPDLLAGWRYKKTTLILSALLIILAISICTHFQIGHWQNSLTLYQHALEVTKDNHLAHNNMASFLFKQNRFDEAAEEYRKCLQIIPGNSDVHNNLGIALIKQGKLDEALKHFTEALRIKPNFAGAHTNMGITLFLQGNLDEAAVHLAEAIRLDPNIADAHYYLGQTLKQTGKIDDAIMHFEEALRLKPDWVEPMNNIAWFLAVSKQTSIHNPDKAVRLAQRCCELTGYNDPQLLDTLAAAYAAAGDFSKAIETAEKALQLCQTPEDNLLKDEIESRLILYKARKPYIGTK